MLEIIETCIAIIGIGLSVYELFIKKKSDEKAQFIQNNLIQQINPKYEIHISYLNGEVDNTEIKNMQWKSNRIRQFVAIIFSAILIVNFLIHLKTQSIQSLTDITSIIYMPLRGTMIYITAVIIIFCCILILRGWNNNQSIFSNLMDMKYFTFKIIADIMAFISFILVDHSFLEKINSNIENPCCSINTLLWALMFATQMLWTINTISKLFKIAENTNLYEKKEEQILMNISVYIVSILLFGFTIYTKFIL